MNPAVAAVAFGGAAAWFATAPGAGLARLTPSPRSRRPRVPVLAVLGAAGVLMAAAPRALLPALAAAGLLGWLVREVRAASRRRQVLAEQARVAEFAAAVAVELRAGRPARAAAVAALPAAPWAPAVRRVAEGGGDLVEALRAQAGRPGAGALRDLAACWQVAERTGAGLASSLEVMSATAAECGAHRARVRAELAGVRATGWLLAGLPVLGAALGASVGARPWEVLLTTSAGAVLLCAGVALDVLGLVWLRRMARGAEPA